MVKLVLPDRRLVYNQATVAADVALKSTVGDTAANAIETVASIAAGASMTTQMAVMLYVIQHPSLVNGVFSPGSVPAQQLTLDVLGLANTVVGYKAPTKVWTVRGSVQCAVRKLRRVQGELRRLGCQQHVLGDGLRVQRRADIRRRRRRAPAHADRALRHCAAGHPNHLRRHDSAAGDAECRVESRKPVHQRKRVAS